MVLNDINYMVTPWHDHTGQFTHLNEYEIYGKENTDVLKYADWLAQVPNFIWFVWFQHVTAWAWHSNNIPKFNASPFTKSCSKPNIDICNQCGLCDMIVIWSYSLVRNHHDYYANLMPYCRWQQDCYSVGRTQLHKHNRSLLLRNAVIVVAVVLNARDKSSHAYIWDTMQVNQSWIIVPGNWKQLNSNRTNEGAKKMGGGVVVFARFWDCYTFINMFLIPYTWNSGSRKTTCPFYVFSIMTAVDLVTQGARVSALVLIWFFRRIYKGKQVEARVLFLT